MTDKHMESERAPLKPVDKMNHTERAEYFLGKDHSRLMGCRSHFEQVEKLARADERRKTLEEAAQAIVALRRTRYHYGDWSVYKREACDEVLKVLRALAKQPSEPGEAA